MTFASAVITVSIFKSVLLMLTLLGWAKAAAALDKDAGYYHLRRSLLNAMIVTAGGLAFVLWLAMPIFWLGMLLGLLLIAGSILTYAWVRNPQVPADARWEFSVETVKAALLQRQQLRATRQASIRFIADKSKTASQFKDVPLPDDPHYEPYLAAEDLLLPALARNAERLDLAVTQKDVKVNQVIDGVSYQQEALEPQPALDLIDLLKAEAGLDLQDRRRKQVGHFKVDTEEHGQHELRLTTAGSTRGLTCMLEIDPRAQLAIDFEDLGLIYAQHKALKAVFDANDGVVLIAAPPGQGRSVTLHAFLKRHDPYMLDVHLMEAEREVELEGITQHAMTEDNWAKPLNSILLRDPSVVGVESLTEPAVAELAADAALDGRRLYLGVRAADTFTALRMYAKAVGDLGKAADSLRAITAQKLVRKLCPACRQAYQPDAAALKKMNLPPDRVNQLYKASGKVMAGKEEQPCPTCHGIGYLGRTAVYEVLVVDDEAREFIRQKDMNGLRTHLRRQQMLYMQEVALQKVVAGETSIREASRVLEQDKKPPAEAGKT